MIPADQRDVFDFLGRPEAYGAGVAEVERIDTHISAVFLAGERAYKLKRAVRLPFLDFTSLAARRAACDNELAINRRIAPRVYLGATPVTRDDAGRLAIGGAGAAVDWLVVMHRFDQSELLDRLAARGALRREHMRDLAEAVAAFHQTAERRPERGGRRGMAWTIDNNARSAGRFVPAVFAAAEVEALWAAAASELERVAGLLEARREAGFVRLCHGDLHLGNICLIDGRPTPFDAIEFSDDIACIDVLYDLAFLVMDLDQRASRGHASALFNHYLALTGDYGGTGLLPLFLSCRAGIRAHVCAAMAENDEGEAAERRHEQARAYLALARTYLSPPPPRLLAVGGLSGSGKSRLGRDLAPYLGAAPGAVVLRSDVVRKRLMGLRPEQRLGPDGYTAEVTGRTYGALYEHAAAILAAGQAVVADAVFARPEEREAIEAAARRAGVPFAGLWLEAPPAVMAQRIENRVRNASDATPEVLERQLTYDLGPMTWPRLDTAAPKEETLAAARRTLGV